MVVVFSFYLRGSTVDLVMAEQDLSSLAGEEQQDLSSLAGERQDLSSLVGEEQQGLSSLAGEEQLGLFSVALAVSAVVDFEVSV